MFRSGETAVPLAKIPALAKALEADAAHMFRLSMADQWPDLAGVVDDIFGRDMASKHEVAILLAKWRAATANTDPAPNARFEAAVDAMLKAAFR